VTLVAFVVSELRRLHPNSDRNDPSTIDHDRVQSVKNHRADLFVPAVKAVVTRGREQPYGPRVLADARDARSSAACSISSGWKVTGFVFLAMAAIGAMAGVREYAKYQSGHANGPGRLVLAICFTFRLPGSPEFLLASKAKSEELIAKSDQPEAEGRTT